MAGQRHASTTQTGHDRSQPISQNSRHHHGSELRCRGHVTSKADKAFEAALALKRLQAIEPASMRQSFSAMAASVVNYA